MKTDLNIHYVFCGFYYIKFCDLKQNVCFTDDCVGAKDKGGLKCADTESNQGEFPLPGAAILFKITRP